LDKTEAGELECFDNVHWNGRGEKRADNGRNVLCLDIRCVKFIRAREQSLRDPKEA
jgi:hypothetical protein